MVQRAISGYLDQVKSGFPVLFITGPRQSGKTTLARSHFPEYSYCNLEDLDQRKLAEEDPRGFLEQYKERGVILDEAQRVPGIFSYLQGIVDQSGKMGKYVLTGSQNFLLMERVTQSLAGRVALINLLPFSCSELREGYPGRSADLDQQLYSGGYPPVYDRGLDPGVFHNSYIQTYIERDVRSIRSIGDISRFRHFVQLCAGRIGRLLNLAALGSELGIDAKTVRAWLSVLEASYVLFLLPPYHRNFNKRIVKHPKLYFHDTGLACTLLGLENAGQLRTHYLRGELFENHIIAELFKQRVNLGRAPGLFFWRDNTGNEVDLLLEHGGVLRAVEIKSSATINVSFFAGLDRFQEYASLPAASCHLVYGGDLDSMHREMSVLGWRSLEKIP